MSLYFGRDVRTRLGVAIFDVSGPLVFHTKVEASGKVLCSRTQQANLSACSPQHPLNAESLAGKLWISFFKVLCYDSTRGIKTVRKTELRFMEYMLKNPIVISV